MIAVLLLAIGLAMDAFAAAVARGAARIGWRDGLLLALAFGLFQGAMPLIGVGFGDLFAGVIDRIDHWLAFTLLGYIGVQMIREGLDAAEPTLARLSLRAIVVTAVATSVDAAVAGLTLDLFDVPLPTSLLTIGLVTFALSLVGVAIGARIGTRFGKRAEIGGGAILILLGTRILFDHLGLL
ncbi:manganese efflux pump MntP [Sphingomicrobium arenosum]|uniref:manganese efflux pump MntP n=1 Tax=Sphingomicrobium arenosum TaxID=2233861 RepID=UPI002240F8D4|nr:manganese efflux pump MntP family protein [Sphingomicrobium arenosum]